MITLKSAIMWTDEMEEEYQKAVEWYECVLDDDVGVYKETLRAEYDEKLKQIANDIENGWTS